MNQYEVIFTISGKASAVIEAASKEDAEILAKSFEIDAEVIEWSYEEIEEIECIAENI